MKSYRKTIVVFFACLIALLIFIVFVQLRENIFEKSPESPRHINTKGRVWGKNSEDLPHIYELTRNAIIELKIDYQFVVHDEQTKTDTIRRSNYTASGFIVNYPDFSDTPFILSAGHVVVLPRQENTKYWACFPYAKSPEELELFIVDPLGQQDFAGFRLKNVGANKKLSRHALTLGSSSELKVGDQVFAFGVFKQTPSIFTTGSIVSLNSRDSNFFRPQTLLSNALISYGGSGGPLLNVFGEVVGINVSMTFNPPGLAPMTLSESAPIDGVKETLKQTGQSLVVTHPLVNQIDCLNSWEYIDQELESVGLKRPPTEGVLVRQMVHPQIPAASVLKPGDKIISCAEKRVNTRDDVRWAIFHCYQRQINMVIERDGRRETVQVELIDHIWLARKQSSDFLLQILTNPFKKDLGP